MNPLKDVELSCLQKVVHSNNSFSVDVYFEMFKQRLKSNLIYSPLSLMLAVGMAYEGGKSETSKQIEMAFSLTQHECHEGIRVLNSSLSNNSNVKNALPSIINVANRIWINEGYSILMEFSDTLNKNYGCSAGVVSFSSDSEGARQTINAWVQNETKGNIKDLLKPSVVTPLTRLVITNAIHFKGEWASKFNMSHTKAGDFTLSNDEIVHVDTMFISSKFKYAKFIDDNYETLMLPYADRKFTMVIMLPGKQSSIENLCEMLHSSKGDDLVGKIVSQSQEVMIDGYIPKFKLEFEFEVSEVLKALGIVDLFDESKADLSGISSIKDLSVASVVHKAFIEVDEKGTTAAAATGMVMKVRCAVRKTLFNANRPFGFFIMDNYSKAIVFMGAVLDPR